MTDIAVARTVFNTAPTISELQKHHRNLALLLIVGNGGNQLNEHLKTVPSICLIEKLYDDIITSNLDRNLSVDQKDSLLLWSHATRDEHPIHYLLTYLSFVSSSASLNNDMIVVSVSLDRHLCDMVLPALMTCSLFSTIVVATMSKRYVLSFANNREADISHHRESSFGDVFQDIFERQPSVQDVQHHFDELKEMEKYIKVADGAFRGFFMKRKDACFVDYFNFREIVKSLFDGCNITVTDKISAVIDRVARNHSAIDGRSLLAQSCREQTIADFNFVFDEPESYKGSQTIASSKHGIVGETQLSSEQQNGSAKSFSNGCNQMNDLEKDEEDIPIWALLVVLPGTDKLECLEQTKISITNASSRLNSSSIPLSVYVAVSMIDEVDLLNLMEPYAEKVKVIPVQLKKGMLCSLWSELCQRALEDGCNRFLLSDGHFSIQTPNWVELLEDTFKRQDCVCIGIPPFEDEHNNDDTLATVALHKTHLDIFNTMFPHGIEDRGAEAFLHELWDRTNKYCLPTNCTSYAGYRKNMKVIVNYKGRGRRLEPSINFRDSILESAIQVMKKKTSIVVHKRIDVVVPTYRVNLFELERILSLRLSQSSLDIRQCRVQFWIIVDNPGHRNIEALISKYDRRYLGEGNYFCRIIVQPENVGASLSRNTGMSKSNADFAVLLDDDIVPSSNLLDVYLSATLRHSLRGDIFAGVTKLPDATKWWEKSLVVSKLPEFYYAPKYVDEPSWPVTANACMRIRRHNDNDHTGRLLLFGSQFPKSGGGEDIEIGMRMRRIGGKLVCVPKAEVSHPWFEGTAFGALMHIAKWMTGDSHIAEDLSHTSTVVWVFPGWFETLVIVALPILLWRGVSVFLQLFISVLATEFTVRTLGLARRAYGVDDKPVFITVAAYASLLQMTQDAVRVSCHLKRGRVDCLVRRLDLYDGLRQVGPMQWRLFAKFILICALIFTRVSNSL